MILLPFIKEKSHIKWQRQDFSALINIMIAEFDTLVNMIFFRMGQNRLSKFDISAGAEILLSFSVTCRYLLDNDRL